MVTFADTVERSRQDVFFDPQTSGGLLISVKADQSMELVAALQNAGIGDATEIGEVLHGQEEKIMVSFLRTLKEKGVAR
jgi:selenide,water dikinase